MSGETLPDKYTEWEGEVGRVKVKTFHGEVSIIPCFGKEYILDILEEPEKSIGTVILRLLRDKKELLEACKEVYNHLGSTYVPYLNKLKQAIKKAEEV